MSTGGHVKKVQCGHLYHTHCLREVVERAQSLQDAKCPLCRGSLINNETATPSRRSRASPFPTNPDAINNNPQDPAARAPQGAGERALFRFSTEALLPTWLPIPAFSFEVVRRPPLGAQPQNEPTIPAQPLNEDVQVQSNNIPNAERAGQANQERPPNVRAQPETSFIRRLLLLAGAIPMSPEEEAAALAQLVDMFPQYDRSDLLRELRERGSPEVVAEAILVGVFTGVPRGD